MDSYDVSDLRDIPAIMVPNGQKVVIVRTVTIVYEVDIPATLEGLDISEISLEALVREETDNNRISVQLEYLDKPHIEDDSVMTVEIG